MSIDYKALETANVINAMAADLTASAKREAELISEVRALRAERLELERSLANSVVTKHEAEGAERLRRFRANEETAKERSANRVLEASNRELSAENAILNNRLDKLEQILSVSGMAVDLALDRAAPEPEIVYVDRLVTVEVGELYDGHSAAGWADAYCALKDHLKLMHGVDVELHWTDGDSGDVKWSAPVGEGDLEDAEPSTAIVRAQDSLAAVRGEDQSEGTGAAIGDQPATPESNRDGEDSPETRVDAGSSRQRRRSRRRS